MLYYGFPMTKYFCDLCHNEIKDNHADIEIYQKECHYLHHKYCLKCFYLKSNYSKIHIHPKPYKTSKELLKIKKYTEKLSKKSTQMRRK